MSARPFKDGLQFSEMIACTNIVCTMLLGSCLAMSLHRSLNLPKDVLALASFYHQFGGAVITARFASLLAQGLARIHLKQLTWSE